jgi:MerR family transcriptional regulator, light-induced transcriptional regulator
LVATGASFAAELLNRGAAGYAGMAASQLLDREPELRGQAGAMEAWKLHLGQRAIELAAALAAGEPRLFTERVRWSRKSFAARGQSDRLLGASIQSLRDVLAQALPKHARDTCAAYLDAALNTLAEPAPAIDGAELDPAQPRDRLALQYLQLTLEGRSADAVRKLVQAVADGLDVKSAYVDVLLPAQREIGRLWHADEISIAEEHLVTATTRDAMAVLLHTSERAPANGATLVAACVPGNIHDIGVCALTNLFQLAGWRTIYLGADVPVAELPASAEYFQADLLLLGSTLTTHIQPAATAIKKLRTELDRPVAVLVGGAAFNEAPDLWRTLGADGYAADFDSALQFGAKLIAGKQ